MDRDRRRFVFTLRCALEPFKSLDLAMLAVFADMRLAKDILTPSTLVEARATDLAVVVVVVVVVEEVLQALPIDLPIVTGSLPTAGLQIDVTIVEMTAEIREEKILIHTYHPQVQEQKEPGVVRRQDIEGDQAL
jgi:hypothetical protein